MAIKLETRTYRRVPHNSVIAITMRELSNSTYFINGRVDHKGMRKKTWSSGQLRNATCRYTFRDAGQHLVRVTTSFTGSSAARVEIEVEITKPDGTRHSTAWARPMAGKNEDVCHAEITVSVRQ